MGVASVGVSAAGAAPLFNQCPPVYKDTGCQFLVTVTDSGVTFANDPSQEPYEGSDDALIGVQNNSSTPLSSIPLEGTGLFGFDGDGICDPGGAPLPSGCVPLAKNSSGEPTPKGTTCEAQDEPCGFEPPAGEPTSTTFEAGITIAGFAANGIPVTGYEGPGVWYSGIACEQSSGIVNFSPAIAPGGHGYFGLESPPEGQLKTGNATTLTSNLSGGGQSGGNVTVVQGTPVSDTATVAGCTAASAGGSVSYAVYSNPTCTALAASAGSAAVSGGVGGPSAAEAGLAPGTYYWQATYAGELRNETSTSPCGTEVLTVLAPTTTSTLETGGGITSASLPVLVSTPVTDQAHIAGAQAAEASGSVTYTLYSDSKCAKPVSSSTEVVSAGVATPSAPVALTKTGTYYWTASYSGGGLNAPSASACGSETLIVSKHVSLGLPSGRECRSHRDFAVHPRFPKGAKIVRFEEFINGKLVKSGHLTDRATTVDLIGLPKGTYEVELVTFTASGGSYEDKRTYHTCVPKPKHHKHKKK
ncbi:MAG TPA: Ig-like domain-containing protein [Solirubrobacteraceae bacterium]|nr:Ig-like domain-containing protein [Solirubrobacteraceae bacterium]